ncbi:CU044_2847 family protein [Desulfococcaceae bacterium HSG8]|nr:CU044_2847 family protein [Desulfococcaceae bacterium HSG8]
MAGKLIQLEDGTLVEVEVPEDQVQQISGGFADKVSATFDKIHPLLVRTCKPIAAAWKDLSQEMHIKQAEVQLGLSFEGEGNLYVTKSKAGANLTVKLVLKPGER